MVRVQRVVMPVTGAESWTVLDDGWAPVAPAERYLAHLAGIERSPNTVRAYAHGLRLWFEFLGLHAVTSDGAGIEDVSRFLVWLRVPADNVIVLDGGAARRCETTVNRHLAAVFGFYNFHARSGVELAASLVAWRRVSRGSYKLPAVSSFWRLARSLRLWAVGRAADGSIPISWTSHICTVPTATCLTSPR